MARPPPRPSQMRGPPGSLGPPMGPQMGPPGPRPSAVPSMHNQNVLATLQKDGDGDSKRGKKKDKKRKKKCSRKCSDSDESSSDSDDCDCCCQPAQPSTQIFISQGGGPQSPQQRPSNAGTEAGNGGCQTLEQFLEQSGAASNGQQTQSCFQPVMCSPSKKKKNKSKPCCPPMMLCSPQKQKKPECCCAEEKQRKKKGGTMDGMMPATQQFLMFLQAYGLAAALIRDRGNRTPGVSSAKPPQEGMQYVPVMLMQMPTPPAGNGTPQKRPDQSEDDRSHKSQEDTSKKSKRKSSQVE